MKTCPFCQKEVQDNAFKCKFCGAWFSDDAEAKQKVVDNEERTRKLLQLEKDKTGEALSEQTQCFSISTRKLIVMSFLTAGLYDYYWFYRNWRAIKIQENKKLSPFWRSVLAVLFCYTLFKRILRSAKQRGYQSKAKPVQLTVTYILFVLISSEAPYPYDTIGILSVIPLLYINRAIRFNNLSIDPNYPEQRRPTVGEILFVIAGISYWITCLIDLIYPTSPV